MLTQMLTEQQITDNRDRIIRLLQSTKRRGMDEVVKYLDDNGFFVVPSSLNRHHNWRGGLAQHALGVYDRLEKTGGELPEESRIITSLLHDICKARLYYYDNEGNLCQRDPSELHISGHGARSVRLLENCGLELTEEEKGAIRWHMGGYNLDKSELRDFFRNKNNELWRLHYNADRYDASHNDKQP